MSRAGFLLVAIAFLGPVLFLIAAAASMLFPFGLEYGEGPILDQATRLNAGENIYKADLNTPPYVIANYPPLFPWLMGALGQAVGWPLLAAGRAVSALAALAAALFLGLLARDASGKRWPGLLAGALFLGNPFVLLWCTRARVDALALALSLAGLWLALGAGRSRRRLLLAVLCLAAAIFTRQTYGLAAPLTVAVWLWLAVPERRRAVAFVAALAALCLTVFVALNQATQGGFFLHIVTANANAYSVGHVLSVGQSLVVMMPVALLLAAAGLARVAQARWPADTRFVDSADGRRAVFVAPTPTRPQNWGRVSAAIRRVNWSWVSPQHWGDGGAAGDGVARPDRKQYLFALAVYTCAAFLSALTIGKVGSSANYLLELIAAMSVWLALTAGALPAPLPRRQAALAVAVLLQAAWLLGASFLSYDSAIAARWRSVERYQALLGEVRAAGNQGPVLADDYMDMVVLAGQRLYYQPFEYNQLIAAGLWSPTGLVREVERGAFPLILLNNRSSALFGERWSPAIVGALDAHYVQQEQLGSLAVYRPAQQ